jgi:predicted GIY-YIG superfamily endonuclease
MYFVYILKSKQSSNGKSFYIGVTSNLFRRLGEHNSPLNTGYTRGKRWKVVYIEGYVKKSMVYKRERQLKQHGNVWYSVMKRVREP